MDITESKPEGDAEDNGKVLRWRIHPLEERPLQGLLLIGIIVACTWAFWSMAGQFYGILCLAVLAVSLTTFFLPTTYELDDEGVEIISLFMVRNFRPWKDFRSFRHDKIGVQLSPYSGASRMTAYRGNFLRFSPDNRDEVIAFLDERIRPRKETL